MDVPVLIPQNSFYRRIINFIKNINFVNVLVKKINVCRKIEINRILKHGDFKKLDVVLDIGSGDGYWTNYFRKHCSKITGIEPYKEHLTIAKKNYSDKCDFVLGSAEKLSFNSYSFDKIISVCVFEHLFNDKLAFSEMYRVLKPAGKLMATVDSLNSEFIEAEFRQKHRKECYCAQLYTIKTIRDKLTEAGFKNVKANFIIGSRISVFYEMLSERIGAISYFLMLPLYPFIMLSEKKFKKSGYKIFVVAEK